MIEVVSLNCNSIVNKPGKNSGLPPWHILAFVDPTLKWLRSWLHSHHSRSIFFKLVTQRRWPVTSTSAGGGSTAPFLGACVENVKLLVNAVKSASSETSPNRKLSGSLPSRLAP